MGDQFLVSLLPVQDNFTITMNSKLSLILFGILVVAALAAAMTEDEEMELSEEIASARVERDAGDRRRRKNGGNKRPRKQRGRKARKGKGKRKNQRRPNGARKGQGRQSTSTSANSTCFENAVFYMKLWKDVVGNFEKQNKRMTKQNSTGQSKSGKKGTFAPIAFKLVDIGGGNKTNMSCGGSYNNSGAMQLQNLTKTLFDCELSVNASCNPANFPQPNTTFITKCENLTSSFKTAVQACLNKTIGGTKTNVSDACGCWVGPQLNQTAQSIKSCKASDSAKAISKQLSKCQKAFSVCRKYEDDAIPAIMACAQDSTKLTAKAKTLAANNASLSAAKTKMSSLSSSNSSSGRRVRATATSCAEILTKAAALSTKVSQKPTADISAEAKEISDVPSTDAEKTSMKTQVTSMESAISSVSKALSSVQTLLSTLTGTTIASSSLVTSASTSTAASSGRRERLVRDLMRNKF